MNTSGSTKTVDLVAVFDAAYEPEWERVAEQDDSASASGEADRMATAAGIRAVLAALPPEPEGTLVGWIDPIDGSLIATHGRETGGSALRGKGPPAHWIPAYARLSPTKEANL